MPAPGRHWNFVTSHGVVLIEIRRDPDATVRSLSERAGFTERQAHRVLGDLVNEGYLVRERVGRRNTYRINETQPMRRPTFASHSVGELLTALAPRR
jgi:DNA-binding MarR family transcriptional regulator